MPCRRFFQAREVSELDRAVRKQRNPGTKSGHTVVDHSCTGDVLDRSDIDHKADK
jgi:hypothetical protein